MEGDYQAGGGWGDCINFDETDFDTNTFRVHGFKSIIPKVGQTLAAEFKKSFIKFKFTEVEKCGDPADMFFAAVEPIEQIVKD